MRPSLQSNTDSLCIQVASQLGRADSGENIERGHAKDGSTNPTPKMQELVAAQASPARSGGTPTSDVQKNKEQQSAATKPNCRNDPAMPFWLKRSKDARNRSCDLSADLEKLADKDPVILGKNEVDMLLLKAELLHKRSWQMCDTLSAFCKDFKKEVFTQEREKKRAKNDGFDVVSQADLLTKCDLEPDEHHDWIPRCGCEPIKREHVTFKENEFNPAQAFSESPTRGTM